MIKIIKKILVFAEANSEYSRKILRYLSIQNKLKISIIIFSKDSTLKNIKKSLKSYKEYNNEPVLTGDFMNEYVADYTSEIINGVEYYPQIKQSNTIKQRFFIKGLDSSDRENGIFNYFNIPIFQPYSFVDLYYKKLPEGYLNKGNIKHELNKKLISNKIYKLISKKKVRAQVGGNNQGILKYMVKNKIFQTLNNNEECFNYPLVNNFETSENIKILNKWSNLNA